MIIYKPSLGSAVLTFIGFKRTDRQGQIYIYRYHIKLMFLIITPAFKKLLKGTTSFEFIICIMQPLNSMFLIQGYPQRMRLQRRLYGICLVPFLTYRVPCRPELLYFCAYSFRKPSKYSIECRNSKSSLKSSYFYSFGSSLQSHPLWVNPVFYWGSNVMKSFICRVSLDRRIYMRHSTMLF